MESSFLKSTTHDLHIAAKFVEKAKSEINCISYSHSDVYQTFAIEIQ